MIILLPSLKFYINNFIGMRKGFIVRDKSLSSLPSRQLSVNQFMTQKSLALRSYQSKIESQSKLLNAKDEDISKLKINLDNALKMAVSTTIESNKAKEESTRASHNKILYQRKYYAKDEEYRKEKELRMQLQTMNIEIEHQKQKAQQKLEKEKSLREQAKKKIAEQEKLLQEMEDLKERVTQIQTLTSRIKTLELTIRQSKLENIKVNKEKKQVQLQKQELQEKIRAAKPYQQQLQQRIAYLERVNLQLERKMQDYYKREHEYKKQISFYKNSLAKMTSQKNKFKANFQETSKTLEEKLQLITKLNTEIKNKQNRIQELSENLQASTKKGEELQKKIEDTAEHYKAISEQNIYLKKRNKVLQQFEDEARRTINGHIRVADETNGYIISRNAVINGLEEKVKMLKDTIEDLQKKFKKFDKCLQDNTMKSETELKESFYKIIRENNQIKLQKKEMTEDFDEKIMKYGEQRDALLRKIQLYNHPMPTEQTVFQAVIHDKTQQILMLEGSNDQLLKLKKQFEEKIMQLQIQKEEQKKEIMTLKLKASDLFRVKKQMDQAKRKMQRYQEMIQEQKQTITDFQQQIDVLRSKSKVLQQRNFNLDLDNKNQSFKIQEMEHIMKQLDIEYLTTKKIQNEKNSHVLTDAVEKMQNGIDSLAYFFSCCYCGELLSHPITLALCGHNYCTKCKHAYNDYCYECDTGQPIQKVFSSKFLKETAAKYKFLLMVVKEARTNLIKINTT